MEFPSQIVSKTCSILFSDKFRPFSKSFKRNYYIIITYARVITKAIIIKGHNQQEYEDKWQGWQDWTDEKLATNLTKDHQQPILLLPAKRWPNTLPECESEGWWQTPQTRVKCRHCLTNRCGFTENPSLRSNKCNGCEKQMQTKGKRLDGIVFTNADP